MPPKAKHSKEEIIQTTLAIVREKGELAVTAREIGAALGMSSRPVFTWYNSMEELKADVRTAAEKVYFDYVDRGLSYEIPFLGVGLNVVAFAREERELYKLLFLSSSSEGNSQSQNKTAMGIPADSRGVIKKSIMSYYKMNEEEADCFFTHLWLIGYSMSAMIVTGYKNFSEEETRQIFAQASVACCKSIKEIDGFANGSFDSREVFKALLSGKDDMQER